MTQKCVEGDSLIHLKITASWGDDTGGHTAIQHFEQFNVWRDLDLLPQPLVTDIRDQPAGSGSKHAFAAGELLPAWSSAGVKQIQHKHFVGHFRSGQKIQPRVGRFYPQGMISELAGGSGDSMLPVRLIANSESGLVFDFTHPLARQRLELEAEVVDIMPPPKEHGGRCTEAVTDVLNGPGMQQTYPDIATDFFSPGAFDRVDEEGDDVFYNRDRMTHHLDANARASINDIYAQLLGQGGRVLDLMSSWESHLTGLGSTIELHGLGMNRQELAANSLLDGFLLHDLNLDPEIPLPDESFDAVVCTASVEYLTQPLQVFREVRRLLKPGGLFAVTFSNRWFTSKAVMLWAELHEFERMGMVAEYLRQSGWSGAVNTLSIRGRARPQDDPHYVETCISDPVYAVWSRK